jgi:trk system potassium uptake protein TrkA
MLVALVEEAVSVGDLVRLFTFRQGAAELVEMTLPADSSVVGSRVDSITWPQDTAPVALVRGNSVRPPAADDVLEPGDELLFVATPEREPELQALMCSPGHE